MQILIDRGYEFSTNTGAWHKGYVIVRVSSTGAFSLFSQNTESWEPADMQASDEKELLVALSHMEASTQGTFETFEKNANAIVHQCREAGFFIYNKYREGYFYFYYDGFVSLKHREHLEILRLGYDPDEEDDMQFELSSENATVYSEGEFVGKELQECFEAMFESSGGDNEDDPIDRAAPFIVTDSHTATFREVPLFLASALKCGVATILHEKVQATFDFAGSPHLQMMVGHIELPSFESVTVVFKEPHGLPI